MYLPTEITDALAKCYWPGRCQLLRYRNMTLYVDGAHTIDSLHLCIDWFNSKTNLKYDAETYLNNCSKLWNFFHFILIYISTGKKFLLFNITGDRNVNEMLNVINAKMRFEQALFTPNVSTLCSQAAKGKIGFIYYLIVATTFCLLMFSCYLT